MSEDRIIRDDRSCWLNEDCIAGYHPHPNECRFPSWTDDAAEGDYDSMIERARSDPSFRDGLLAAASICRAQGTNALLPPCPSDMAAVYITSVAFGRQP